MSDVVRGGREGDKITVSPFFRPFDMSLVTWITAFRSTFLFFNPTGTAIILIDDFFDAYIPFDERASLRFFYASVNVWDNRGSFLWEFPLFILFIRVSEISTPIILAPALSQTAAIEPPTLPSPYIANTCFVKICLWLLRTNYNHLKKMQVN